MSMIKLWSGRVGCWEMAGVVHKPLNHRGKLGGGWVLEEVGCPVGSPSASWWWLEQLFEELSFRKP